MAFQEAATRVDDHAAADSRRALLSRIAAVLFMAGVFLMVSGDLPRLGLRPLRRLVNVASSSWLYVAFFALAVVVLAVAGKVGRRHHAATNPLLTPLLALGAAFIPSVALSQVPGLSWLAFGCYVVFVAFVVLAGDVLEDDAHVAIGTVVLTAAALVLAIRALVWRAHEGITLPTLNIGNNAWLGKLQIAWVLTLVAPFVLARFLQSRAPAAFSLYGGGWLVLGAAVYVLYSRTASLALVLSTTLVCALNPQYWRRALALLAVVGVGAAVMLGHAGALSPDRLAAMARVDRDAGIVMRQGVWRDTLPMVRDHPLVGVGLGAYDDIAYSVYRSGADPHFFRNGWHAHNLFLHLLAETGIIGLAGWCYFWFCVIRFLIARRRDGDASARLNSTAALSAVVALFVLALTEALIGARVHASLRMNLTLLFLMVYGCRLAAATAPRPPATT